MTYHRLLWVPLVHFVGCNGESSLHEQHVDAGHDLVADQAADGAPTTDATQSDAMPGVADGATSGDAANACQPACGAGQVCCVDQHGHFPKCLAGSSCP